MGAVPNATSRRAKSASSKGAPNSSGGPIMLTIWGPMGPHSNGGPKILWHRGKCSGYSSHGRTNICSADSRTNISRQIATTYMRVIQLCQIDAGSSTCSLSVLLSAMERSLRTCIVLEGVSAGIINTHVPCSCAVCTSHGYYLLILLKVPFLLLSTNEILAKNIPESISQKGIK